MTTNIPVIEGALGPPPIFGIFGAIIDSVVTVCWAVPLIVIIAFLRGKTIRGALL
jgi:hypothetical protein